MKYAKHVSTKATPQSEPVPGKGMVPNSAGGYGFAVDDWVRLDRFLILGCEGGSYYATERTLTVENAEAVVRCVKADGVETVRRIVAVSEAGRAPKNDPAVFALALAAAHGDAATKKAAYAAVPKVCRIGTHLFQFAAASDALRGWGRGLRQAVADWYTTKSARDLGYQVTKYQQRDGWSHRDLLRLAHPKAADPVVQAVLRWVTHGAEARESLAVTRTVRGERSTVVYPAAGADLPEPVRAFELAKRAETADEVARLVREYRLVRECVPTQFLDDPLVWDALLEEMPATALLRNLATLTRVGVVTPGSLGTCAVVAALTDPARLKKARVHPLAVLTALRTYAQGRGFRGGHTWTPVPEVVAALEQAFYLAFDAVEPTGKRWLFGIDVSGSMSSPVAGSPLSCCEAATALALVAKRTEPDAWIGRFNTGLERVPFTRDTRLEDALAYTRNINGGGTDCALPMTYAAMHTIAADVFCVITDSETWAGAVHPFQALKQYRDKTGIPAKLIVVGMVSNGFTIADPSDAGMLDVVGFDTTVPAVMADFARN
jgi:60 kDa SS-A/Ro ribonucleoprotein